MTNNHIIKLALVCTQGGHFEQMTNLTEFINCYDHFWLTNRNKQTESQLKGERVYYIEMAHFTKPWTYLFQMAPVLKIFAKERPTHILSTGSGRTALIPFLLSRLLRKKFIYIDTFSRVNGCSKFGTFLLKMGHVVYTQWEDNSNNNTIFIGAIFKQQESQNKNPGSNYVFLTLGTRDEPFTRLLQGVEELVKKGTIKEKVIVQAGHTKYRSDHMEIFDFCAPEKIGELILNAKYVITQESAGIGTQCLKHRTKFIVMPRDYQYAELPTQSDMNEDLQYRLEELGYTKVVTDTDELEKAILSREDIKTGFTFNNKLAIEILHKALKD